MHDSDDVLLEFFKEAELARCRCWREQLDLIGPQGHFYDIMLRFARLNGSQPQFSKKRVYLETVRQVYGNRVSIETVDTRAKRLIDLGLLEAHESDDKREKRILASKVALARLRTLDVQLKGFLGK